MSNTISLNQKEIFDSIRQVDQDNKEYWRARELMPLLGYDQWRNFHKVIQKAIASLTHTYPHIEDHFVKVDKKIKIASGSEKEATRVIVDYKLTRYACYLIAQNGDSKKQEIAYAQSYFAVQTRKHEIREERERQMERIIARRKLRDTEKKLSGVLADHGVESRAIAEIRSAGDQALFNMPTREIKSQLGVDYNTPLADHLPTITLKAKDLAAEITTFNTKEKDLFGKDSIKKQHINNNTAVRKLLNENGIYPERLPAEEDIKKLESKISEEELRRLKTNDFLELNEIVIDIRRVKDEGKLMDIKEMIDTSKGNKKMKIIYGSLDNPRVIVRKVDISNKLITSIKEYLVI